MQAAEAAEEKAEQDRKDAAVKAVGEAIDREQASILPLSTEPLVPTVRYTCCGGEKYAEGELCVPLSSGARVFASFKCEDGKAPTCLVRATFPAGTLVDEAVKALLGWPPA